MDTFFCPSNLYSNPLYGQTDFFDPKRKYSEKSLKDDLLIIREKLGKTHPELYRYTLKPSFDLVLTVFIILLLNQ